MVTLIFCPGLRFFIPTPAPFPDGLGSTLTGSFVVTLKLFLAGRGFAFVVDLGVAFGDALFDGMLLPSTTVTLIF